MLTISNEMKSQLKVSFFINCSHLVEWPAQLNLSSWILTHLQETAKNTSLPSLFDPLTLALSIRILFYLICLLFIKEKHTHLTLYRLHIYSLTASFSCKTNTMFLCSIFYILIFKKNKKKNLPTCQLSLG